MAGYPMSVRSLLIVAALASTAAAQLPGVHLSPAPAKLRFEPRCVLHAVALEMADKIGRHRPGDMAARMRAVASGPIPPVRYASSTPLAEFQRAVRRQAPGIAAVTNMYSLETGEVFLLDDASYYASVKRAMDDSLAHEFVHFLQHRFLGYGLEELAGDDSAEMMAVEYQTWFRDEFVNGRKPVPCP